MTQTSVKSLTSNWRFREENTSNYLPATVPGVVHTDLMASKKISDPFYRNNEKEVQWIEEKNWEYESVFSLSAVELNNEFAELVCEGLDTYAEVYINNTLIGKADNMYRTWVWGCKQLLKEGDNTIRVLFKSPLYEGKTHLDKWGYELPAANDYGKFKVSPFVRKSPYHFGWDWGPRLVTSGIWRPLFLRFWNKSKINSVKLTTEEIQDADTAVLGFDLSFDSLNNTALQVEMSLNYKGAVVWSMTQDSVNGCNPALKGEIVLQNPKLWMPRGYGEPHLYEFTVKLKEANGTILDEKTIKTGIRTTKLVREKEPNGESFYFVINGIPVFMKGSDYIPRDNFLTRPDKNNLELLIRNAYDANMNMIRIWGGGIYEENRFYELCDELGIMVWQDFMFACTMYPGNQAFLNNIEQEFIDNIKRLRHHPSIVYWNGNNEINVAWLNWGWQKLPQFLLHPKRIKETWAAYEAIFMDLIPKTLEKYDGTRPYCHTSPLSNWGKEDRFNYGTQHYWGVWHGTDNFDGYRKYVGRFNAEYGFQSFPSMSNIKTFALPEDMSIESPVMKHHQKSYVGNGMIRKHVDIMYPQPTDFEHFIYLSQLVQAEAIGLAIAHHRRRKPHCMGTLYWQLNDSWPGPSWSSVDYYGEWKALQYFVKNRYKDVITLIDLDPDKDVLGVHVVNDVPANKIFNLYIELMNFEGKVLDYVELPITAQSNSSQIFWSKSRKAYLKDYKPTQVFMRAILKDGNTVVCEDYYYFVVPRLLELKQPNITTSYLGLKNGKHTWEMQTNVLAKNIEVQLPNTLGHFNDNFFDLIPGIKKEITYHPHEVLQGHLSNLMVRNLAKFKW